MEAAWFVLIAFMLTVYVILDGFDFGAGILHLFVAKTDDERRTVLSAIGPFWDGNEVWLIAAGGVLVFAFPRVYAAAFSGFYLPLMMVLWLLILRGVSIEFRSHQSNPLWRSFWDATFALASVLIALVLGASLGNLIRGVPLDSTGYFHIPLFTNFRIGSELGALDWYTITGAIFVLSVLAGHGALFLSWRTSGGVAQRSEQLARRIWILVLAMGVVATIATSFVQPALFRMLKIRPWSWPLLLLVFAALAVVYRSLKRRKELAAFLGSAGFIAGMLAMTAAAMFPTILPSRLDPENSLTIWNSSSGRRGLSIGLAWWVPAVLLAIGYFVYLFRSFRGKVTVKPGTDGY